MWNNKNKITSALFLAVVMSGATTAMAQAPAPYDVTPELITAAKAEKSVVFYSATDVAVAEKLAKSFQDKYPGISVQVERAGSERVFQRIGQEESTGIHTADVIETSDAVHFVYMKRQGWLTPMVPKIVAERWPADERDPDGLFAAYRAHLSVMAYNTDLLKESDAPKTWKDLLDPRFKGKMVKGHPGYSGTVMTATHVLSDLLVGIILKSLVNRMSCRSSRLQNRRRSWLRKSVRSRLMGMSTTSSVCRTKECRSRSFIPLKVHL